MEQPPGSASPAPPNVLAVRPLPTPGCFLLSPDPEPDLDPPISLANWYSSSKPQLASRLRLASGHTPHPSGWMGPSDTRRTLRPRG